MALAQGAGVSKWPKLWPKPQVIGSSAPVWPRADGLPGVARLESTPTSQPGREQACANFRESLLTSEDRLEFARQQPSPNCSARPEGGDISLLVIHNISLPPGQYGGGYVDALFCNELDPQQHPYFAEIAHLRVSAHLLIARDGSVTQYVPFDQKAWHAGKSCFSGRDNCNDYSIGIELEGSDHEAFTAAQYEQLAKVTHWLRQRYPLISPERIVGHSDIAPGRKTDPGPFFDWTLYRASVLNSEPAQ